MSDKHKRRLPATLDDQTPWQVSAIRLLSVAVLATSLIADNGSPTVSSLSKVAVLQILVGLIVAIWLPLALVDRRYRPRWRNPLVLGTSLFVAALTVSLIGSLDPYRSFWSSAYRLTGVFNYWHYWAWLLVLVATHRGWKDWRPLLVWSNLIAVVIDLVGFYRVFISPEHLPRLASTIDNALYLAAFLLLQFFIAIILAVREENRWRRWGFVAAALLHAVALFMTGSRSAFVAMLGGLLILGVWLPLRRLQGRRRLWFAGLTIAGIVLVLAGVIWIRSPRATVLHDRLPVFARRILLASDFGQDRVSLDAIAWESFLDHPWLGWGLDHFEIAFEKHYQPVGRDYVLIEPWYDRAHNQFADFLATTGIIGFAAYLFLWLMALVLPIRRLLRQESPSEIQDLVLFVALVTYGGALFFSFDMPGPMTVQWLLFAFAIGVSLPDPEPGASHADDPLILPLTLMLTLALGGGELWWSLRPYSQARQVEQACAALATRPDEALAAMRDVSAQRTFASPELRFRMMSCADPFINDSALPSSQRSAVAKTIAEVMTASLRERPYDYKTTLATGYSWMMYGRFAPAAMAEADQDFAKALTMSPRRYRTYEELAEMDLLAGDLGQAADHLEQALELTYIPSERGRLALRAAAVTSLNGDLAKTLVYLHLAAVQPGYDLASNATLLAPLVRIWPAHVQLDEVVRRYALAVMSRRATPDVYGAGYRLFVKADEPAKEITDLLQTIKSAYPDLADQLLNEATSPKP